MDGSVPLSRTLWHSVAHHGQGDGGFLNLVSGVRVTPGAYVYSLACFSPTALARVVRVMNTVTGDEIGLAD
jgi:hypothetical protein